LSAPLKPLELAEEPRPLEDDVEPNPPEGAPNPPVLELKVLSLGAPKELNPLLTPPNALAPELKGAEPLPKPEDEAADECDAKPPEKEGDDAPKPVVPLSRVLELKANPL